MPDAIDTKLTLEQEYFKGQVAEAKKHVQEPPQPTLKLNMKKPGVASSGIKLRLGQKESPAPPGQARDSATPGAQAAGQQQKVPVKLNGTAQGAPARASSRPPSEAAAVATPAMNGIKPEQSMSAALDAQQQMRPPSQQPAMLPPSRAGMANGTPMPAPSFTSHSYAPPAPTGFDNRFRQDGRGTPKLLLGILFRV